MIAAMRSRNWPWVLLCLACGTWLCWQAGRAAADADPATAQAQPAADAAEAAEAGIPWHRALGVTVAALCTLAVFSFLIGDNPAYRVVEAVVVGVSAAYNMVLVFWTAVVPDLLGKLLPDLVQRLFVPGLQPDPRWYLALIPAVLGLMLLMRLSPRGGWIARWPVALIIGTFMGFKLTAYLHADFLSQIRAALEPLLVYRPDANGAATLDPGGSLKAVLLLAGTLATLTYFFFSVEHRGAVGKVARVGTWVLMITFGASFGYTVMGRIALLAERIGFLLEWPRNAGLLGP